MWSFRKKVPHSFFYIFERLSLRIPNKIATRTFEWCMTLPSTNCLHCVKRNCGNVCLYDSIDPVSTRRKKTEKRTHALYADLNSESKRSARLSGRYISQTNTKLYISQPLLNPFCRRSWSLSNWFIPQGSVLHCVEISADQFVPEGTNLNDTISLNTSQFFMLVAFL